MTEKRIEWIDMARGLCMIAILMFHTEMYYCGSDLLPYALYVPDVLATFFFISGYLMRRSHAVSLSRRLYSIVKGIVVPYFIFTSLFAVAKALAGIGEDNAVAEIVMGEASWFVAALAVAEALFALLIESRAEWIALPLSATAFLVGESDIPDVWCWKGALLSLLFVYAGYLFRKWESRIKSGIGVAVASFAVLIASKWLMYLLGAKVVYYPVIIENPPLFVVDMLAGALLIITVCKMLPPLGALKWIGRHSLYYYFLCGAVPMAVTMLLGKAGLPYRGNVLTEVLALIIVYATSTVAVSLCIIITRIFTHPANTKTTA